MFWNNARITWLLLTIGITLQLGSTLEAEPSKKILNLKNKITVVRKECITAYNAFFAALFVDKSKHETHVHKNKSPFPEKINELISVNQSFHRQGTPLLTLIQALENKEYLVDNTNCDENINTLANAALTKINELFCLKFLCMICGFDCSKNIDKSILKGFYSLLNVKIENESSAFFPFHTLLSEIAITILMIKFNNLPYKTKKESLVYNLSMIHEKLLATNKSLFFHRLSNTDITDFIDSLGQYALKKPIVSSDRVNFFAKTAIATLIVGGIVCYALNKEFPKWVKGKCKEMFGGIMEFLGPTYIGENTIKAVKSDMNNVVESERSREIIETGRAVITAAKQATEAANNVATAIAPVARVIGSINWRGVGVSLAATAVAATLHTMGFF